MSKICTDIEQSKKLLKLGIDLDTADMWYIPIEINGEKGYELVLSASLTRGIIPAWSLSALLELMPYPFLSELSSGIWKCGCYPKGMCNYLTSDSSLGAAFEMICHLLTNKLM